MESRLFLGVAAVNRMTIEKLVLNQYKILLEIFIDFNEFFY